MSPRLQPSTYDHRVWKTGLPVRSTVLKPGVECGQSIESPFASKAAAGCFSPLMHHEALLYATKWKIRQTGDDGIAGKYAICFKRKHHPAGGPDGFQEMIDLTL
ncbi:uncharacterized protein AFUA_1G13650 [Aspergillus fumigatus Af293]|uniref:Uncharacterized protein n=2 Tax=Aspergillus fumigatus TaxID=746128 RepID=Q4WS85_ASPFU|nr:hypothetical protein AFUA_1G13650 [Aspergillus fumigatus Af293]EAL90697.1 hypothetical protein AFUA_1G13650 [Aspergillus fumigatus Af293]EDP56603.1 hypothetical protein AFUB_013140 [Aspergillus fumigatus A1163]